MMQRELLTIPKNTRVKIVSYGDLRRCPGGGYVDLKPWLVGKTSVIIESISHYGFNRYKLSSELFKDMWFTEEQLRPMTGLRNRGRTDSGIK